MDLLKTQGKSEALLNQVTRSTSQCVELRRENARFHEIVEKAFKPCFEMQAFVFPSSGYEEIPMVRSHCLEGDCKIVVEAKINRREMRQLQFPRLWLEALSEQIGRLASKQALEKLRLFDR